ncbi:MAG: hypothetical protein E6J77_02175 [Deltaproteobacteria bacterium]|nr:MAG: hypothetical protein E6J77_02175 [Deltaproteobacteria bacterium]
MKMLRRVLRSVPIDLLDKRSAIGVAARKRREELIDHCGGAEAVSPAQVILIDTAVKTELIVRAAEDYILRQETLVVDHGRLPVVMQRQQLADSLCRMLEKIGMDRKAREVTSLHDYLAERSKQTEPVQPAGGGGGDETVPEMRHNASESR